MADPGKHEVDVRPDRSLRRLSRAILSCASSGRPSVDFLLDCSRLLLDFLACDGVDLWLAERRACARWSLVGKPERFVRLADVPVDLLERLASEGPGRCLRLAGADAAAVHPGLTEGQDRRGALAWTPLLFDDDLVGLLLLRSRAPASVGSLDQALFQDVALVVSASVVHHRVQFAQRERVKELTCLYRIAREAARAWVDLGEVLARILDHLPPGWQYPEITVARIVLDCVEHCTPDFACAVHRQRADITIDGATRGFVEVAYTADRPTIDEGPFLEEERSLLDTVASEVALVIQRRRAEADRRQLQDQLRHADRLATIGQLAAGVAHELNEPLGGILGFAQLSRKDPEAPAQVRQDLERIEGAALHARDVIRKLMLFARQTPPTKKSVRLDEVVRDGLSFLESRCATAGIRLELALGADLPEITADGGGLHQILVNLVVNALQATPAGGSVTVETRAEGDHVVLAVSDTGGGMSSEVAAKVFEPFFTTKDVGQGTGLGLAVVHGIVSAHAGTIRVESHEGRGARVEVRLPVEGPDADA